MCWTLPKMQEYYSHLFGTPLFDAFMRGGVVAWEYAETHLTYWKDAKIPSVHYVRHLAGARLLVKCLSTFRMAAPSLVMDARLQKAPLTLRTNTNPSPPPSHSHASADAPLLPP